MQLGVDILDDMCDYTPSKQTQGTLVMRSVSEQHTEMVIFMWKRSQSLGYSNEKQIRTQGALGQICTDRVAENYFAEMENTEVCEKHNQKGWDLKNKTEVKTAISTFNNKDGKNGGHKGFLIDFKNKEIVISKITDFENSISDFDLIINATSAGSSTDLDSTPFNLNLLKSSKPRCLVYDIIYDPLKTSLLNQAEHRGLATINGLKMNLIQAVLAYKYTSKTSLTLQEIYETMNN